MRALQVARLVVRVLAIRSGPSRGMARVAALRQAARPGRQGRVAPTHRDACGGLPVAQQQREDIVLAVVAGLGDEGEVRRVRAAIGVAGVLLQAGGQAGQAWWGDA
jgi:hypothetical protein